MGGKPVDLTATSAYFFKKKMALMSLLKGSKVNNSHPSRNALIQPYIPAMPGRNTIAITDALN